MPSRTRQLLGFVILACFYALGCRSSVDGTYGLDLEETKRALEQSAAETPEEAARKTETLGLLADTGLRIELEKSGQLTSTTELKVDGTPRTTSKKRGTWASDGKRVTLKVEDTPENPCEVDGPRLRCTTTASNKFLQRYVLVKR
jgi:hypothetical protein